jgi:hypothetical protein
MLSLLTKPSVMALIVVLGTVFYASNGNFKLVTEYGQNSRLAQVIDQHDISR